MLSVRIISPITAAAPAPVKVKVNAGGKDWMWAPRGFHVDLLLELPALLQDKQHPARLVSPDKNAHNKILYIEVWNKVAHQYVRTVPAQFLQRTLQNEPYNAAYKSWKLKIGVSVAERAALVALVDWIAGEMAKNLVAFLGDSFSFVERSTLLNKDFDFKKKLVLGCYKDDLLWYDAALGGSTAGFKVGVDSKTQRPELSVRDGNSVELFTPSVSNLSTLLPVGTKGDYQCAVLGIHLRCGGGGTWSLLTRAHRIITTTSIINAPPFPSVAAAAAVVPAIVVATK